MTTTWDPQILMTPDEHLIIGPTPDSFSEGFAQAVRSGAVTIPATGRSNRDVAVAIRQYVDNLALQGQAPRLTDHEEHLLGQLEEELAIQLHAARYPDEAASIMRSELYALIERYGYTDAFWVLIAEAQAWHQHAGQQMPHSVRHTH